MTDSYFTPAERAEAFRLVTGLLRRLQGVVSAADVREVFLLIRQSIANGRFARDRHGFNPLLRHARTANLVAEYIAPDRTMALATMLYNLCRADGGIPVSEVSQRFGSDVARVVQGLLNVGQLYRKNAALRDENFQKLLLTFAEDIRVIIIMIVDRLGLMRQLNHFPDEELVRDISRESRYLYAPLAHRLGLYAIKSELEDLSLKYLNRKVYTQIAEKLNESKTVRDQYVADFIEPIRVALQKENMHFEIKGRTKSINSIWNKMKNKDVDLSGMYDLFAIRIILDSEPENEKKDCWVTYSIVENIYTANPDRTKDWITIPKSNGYESLHTTVYGPDNKWVEVQIRTRRMDEIAERGLAAHWKYKGIKSEADLDVWMNSVREILEAGSGGQMELIRNLNMNLYEKEVFVFTPHGDLYRLPQGSSILDFAFAIHSRIGSTCVGGKVDGRNQKLTYRLHSGDTVEVITSSTQMPRLDWLNHVVTAKARNKIRQAVNERRAKQAAMARELVLRRLRNRKIYYDESVIPRIMKRLGYKTLTDFFCDIQEEKLDVATVIEQYEQEVARSAEGTTTASPHGTAEDFVLQPSRNAADHRPAASSDDIMLIGNDVRGINYRLAKCCNPIFGDHIAGFIAGDGAIKIHRINCPNLKHLQSRYPYRILRTEWSGRMGAQYGATLRVVGKDDIGIVANITSVINKTGQTQLRSVAISSHNGMFEGQLVIGVDSLSMLDDLIKKILSLKGVKSVERTTGR